MVHTEHKLAVPCQEVLVCLIADMPDCMQMAPGVCSPQSSLQTQETSPAVSLDRAAGRMPPQTAHELLSRTPISGTLPTAQSACIQRQQRSMDLSCGSFLSSCATLMTSTALPQSSIWRFKSKTGPPDASGCVRCCGDAASMHAAPSNSQTRGAPCNNLLRKPKTARKLLPCRCRIQQCMLA